MVKRKRNAAITQSAKTQTQPERISSPVPVGMSLYPMAYNTSIYPYAQPKDLYRPISNLERVKFSQLRRFTRMPPVYAAIKQISDGILRMPWRIEPPFELKTNGAALQMAHNATKALRKPNAEATLNTNRMLQAAMADDLLTINYCCVERQQGTVDRPFWLWACNSAMIRLNPNWTPQTEGIEAKFLDYGKGKDPKPIMSEHMFMLINNTNSYEALPPSPLEIAFNICNAWLGLSDYQQLTTSNAVQEHILFLGDVKADQLKAFREYWEVEVVRNKKKMIFAGAGNPQSFKAGAASDAELYPKYCDYLLKIIAMCFAMTTRDMNITEHDNRATASVSADKTFQSAILPVAETIDEGIDSEVVDFYLPGFRYIRTYKEPRGEAELNAESRADYKEGLISRNEARALRGYDPLEEDHFTTSGVTLT